MSDQQAREVYERAGLGQTFKLGERPAVLVIDFNCGFTDPECPLGADLTPQIEATRRLRALFGQAATSSEGASR